MYQGRGQSVQGHQGTIRYYLDDDGVDPGASHSSNIGEDLDLIIQLVP